MSENEEEKYVPSVEPSRIDGFYTQLQAMQVELDADPLALGPKRINQKIAECRRYLSLTERMFTEVSRDLHWFRREHRRASAEFDLSVQELISTDPETRSGKSVTDRIAVAHIKLRKEREGISTLQFAVDDLEAVLAIIRTKRNDLKDISSRLRDQLKVCQEEITLGGRWGGRSRVDSKEVSLEVSTLGKELDDLLEESSIASTNEEEGVEESETPTKEPLSLNSEQASSAKKEVPSEDLQAMDSALDALGTAETSAPRSIPTPKESDENLDSLLDGMEKHLPKPIEAKPFTDSQSLDDLLNDLTT